MISREAIKMWTEGGILPPAPERLDPETFREKLGLWFNKFKPFIESKDMWDIYQKIKEDAKYEIICPDSKDTFRSFTCSDPSTVRVVFYLMDPYPRKYKDGLMQATGIPMDCSNAKNSKLQPSLEVWYDTIDRELGQKVNRSPNLEYLLEQGVLLLNTELTVKLNKTESHQGLWNPFQKYFLEEVMYGTTGVIYVLCGKASHKMEKWINPLGNYIFKIDHPAFAARMRSEWDTGDIFLKINRLLKDNNNDIILWNKKTWQEYCTPPF